MAFCSLRQARITWAPCWARTLAASKPIPLLAPVISTRRPDWSGTLFSVQRAACLAMIVLFLCKKAYRASYQEAPNPNNRLDFSDLPPTSQSYEQAQQGFQPAPSPAHAVTLPLQDLA